MTGRQQVVYDALQGHDADVSVARLKAETRLSDSTLRHVLKNLCKQGHAKNVAHGYYLAVRGTRPGV
jgi:DNA-binding IclR family transcriptional regulator